MKNNKTILKDKEDFLSYIDSLTDEDKEALKHAVALALMYLERQFDIEWNLLINFHRALEIQHGIDILKEFRNRKEKGQIILSTITDYICK